MNDQDTTEPRVKVVHDDDAESPREWDNLGTMACWHGRHHLGDVQPREAPDVWLKENAPPGSVVLPLYLLDHGGLRMKTSDFRDPWDSGRVGWIIATPEQIRAEYKKKRISKKMRADVERILRNEVSTYDDFLTGNVWGFQVSDDSAVAPGDSCYGFIGSDSTLEAMQEHLPGELHEELAKAWENRT